MADSVPDELVAQFTTITGAPARQAAQFLSISQGDLQTALASYYAAQEDGVDDEPNNDSDYADEDDQADEPQAEPHPTFGGGRRLGDGPSDSQPATIASTSQSKPKAKPVKRGGVATLGDFGAAGRNEDDSDDDDEKNDLFAGGEKSALAVQNPDDLKKRILEKAQKRGPPEKSAPPKKSSLQRCLPALSVATTLPLKTSLPSHSHVNRPSESSVPCTSGVMASLSTMVTYSEMTILGMPSFSTLFDKAAPHYAL